MATRIVHNLGDLEADMREIARTFKPKAAAQVRDTARDGNRFAKRRAKITAGAHGKHYHRAFTVERVTPLEWEWGADASKLQGGMSPGFERGSRNSPGHHDHAYGADRHGADDLQRRIGDVLDGLFWPR